MKASDPRLILVAQQANVRTPHVFHLYHSIAENPRAFSPDAFAAFTGLERRHVDRMMAALAANDLIPKKAREPIQGRGARLAADFELPDDWFDFAQREKRWHRFEVEAEFRMFADYWCAQPGQKGIKLDWFATWRTWVRRSRTPNGTWRQVTGEPLRIVRLVEPEPERVPCTPEEAAEILREVGLPAADPIKTAVSSLRYRDL